jgi:phosphatidylglycerol lysyltransferase
VRDGGGEPVAFANVVPPYRSGIGNYDLVRYREAPKGLADLIHVRLIEYFRERGLPEMTLGLAPLSGIDDASSRSPKARALQVLYRSCGWLFRYEGLRDYKQKFHPRWEPRYLVYRSELELPGVALAVARAGELRSTAAPPEEATLEDPRIGQLQPAGT